jgi:Spy/CpxP family protein refolding chaperone
MATKGTKSSSKSSAKSSAKSSRRETPAAKPSGGVDLAAIEKELNSDAEAQAAFAKNPAKFLEDRGLRLRPKDKTELKSLAREMSSGPKAAEGSLAGNERGIKITISRWIR